MNSQNDPLRRFTDSVARRLAGQPEPERDEPGDHEPGAVHFTPFAPVETPAFRAALREELEADGGDEEDDEQPRGDGTPLGDFVAGATAGWDLFPKPVRLEGIEDMQEPVEEPLATSARGFIEATVADAEAIIAEYGSVDEYLVQWALADREAWAATGLPPEAQPGRADLGRRGQAALDAAAWERSMERLREKGRYIE